MTTPDLEDRFVGALLGLALGDALGAGHEGGPPSPVTWDELAAGEEPLTWTDDTQMALGLATSLLEVGGLDPDHLARTWADRYEPWRGYGGGAHRLLRMLREGVPWRAANRAVFPDGSFGNGAAMRAAPLGLWYHADLDALGSAAGGAAVVTHAHPLGIEGGRLVALATALALREPFDAGAFIEALLARAEADVYQDQLRLVRGWLARPPAPSVVVQQLGNGVAAHESAVTAIHAFLRYRDGFEDLVAFVVGLGGDTDTIAAMAGALWGAHRGAAALPAGVLGRLEARDAIADVARALHAEAPGGAGDPR